MTPREKKLMWLVFIVALVALVDFCYSAINEFKSQSLLVSKVQEAQTALDESRAQIIQLPMTAEAKQRLAYATEPLPSDPLVRPQVSFATSVLAGEQLPYLKASGYISMGSTQIAIINGGEYAEGDVIPDTGEVVKTVDDEGVVLSLPENGTERRLLFEEEAIPADEIVIR